MKTKKTRTKKTTTKSKCVYDGVACTGETWACLACGNTYCQKHSHVSSKGHNKECVACERNRKDAELLNAPDLLRGIGKKVDVDSKLDADHKQVNRPGG